MIDAGRFLANLPAGMTIRARNRLIAFSIFAAPFVFLLCLILFWNGEPLPPLPPIPNPNGYDDLVKAGNMVSNDFEDYDEVSLAKLRELISKDAGAMQTARTGLQQKCRVKLVYSATSSAHLDELAAIKELALAFAAQARMAEMEKRPASAVQIYLDMVHLANDSARGGVIIDQLVGLAIESMAVTHLQELKDQLGAKSCCETAAALETLDSQRQTWDEVIQQENDWSRRTFPGIRNEFARLSERAHLEKSYLAAKRHFDAQQSKTRQLIVEFAARAYALDKGHRPANLSDLVPDYLKALPPETSAGQNSD
jgi:hypothetical protein